jgi:hypothetical protein
MLPNGGAVLDGENTECEVNRISSETIIKSLSYRDSITFKDVLVNNSQFHGIRSVIISSAHSHLLRRSLLGALGIDIRGYT